VTAGAPQRVLVTRPRPDAEETARLLAARGIEAVIAPLIDISDIPGATVDMAAVQAILVTSANGVRALSRATQQRDVPVYTVGDASARAAADCGFTDVTSAGGDVGALAAIVRMKLDPLAGALAHVTGSAVAGDLGAELASFQYVVRRSQLYRAQTADTLPDAARNALNQDETDAVLFYSPRTAAQFVKLVAEAGLQQNCQRLIACCLSDAVAAALAGLSFAQVRIAATPNQDALLAVLVGEN
jgi:uroporphyrinogen-III synthase